jgi:hypothetical protein
VCIAQYARVEWLIGGPYIADSIAITYARGLQLQQTLDRCVAWYVIEYTLQ